MLNHIKKIADSFLFKQKFYNHSLRPDFLYALDKDNKANVGMASYNENTIVHRCVSLIATSASHIPWKIYIKNNGNKQIAHNHPVETLLKHPNPQQSGSDFFIETISNMLLYGNSYILIVGENSNFEIYNLHPSQIQHILSKQKIVGYKYFSHDSSKIFKIPPITRVGKILHFKNYNPLSQETGMSPLSAVSESIGLYANIIQWNKSLLKHASRPTGVLAFQDGKGHLSEEQFQRLQDQFYSSFSGFDNSGKPIILEGGLKWQDTNCVEKFEKFIELKDSISRDIAIAFNIPPQLLGIAGDNTYSNMQEARLALWEENIIPLLDKYSDSLSYWLSYWYDQDIQVDFDRDSISVLTQRREDVWAKLSNANFMTINEKRAFFGLPPLKGEDTMNKDT